uniref:Uncharacterized protein n=1 Tax=Vespula pensylvanica TaxID=30213 RepID=A0A834U9T1_VESPE|nr:hypothetical protein H0235_009113 [Vespula pensylvanica]
MSRSREFDSSQGTLLTTARRPTLSRLQQPETAATTSSSSSSSQQWQQASFNVREATYGTTITVLRTLPIATYRVFHEHSKFPEVEEILGRNDTVSRDMQSSSSKRRKELVSLCSSNLHPLSKYGGRGSYVGYRRYRVSSGLEERWVYNTGTVRTDILERLVIIDSEECTFPAVASEDRIPERRSFKIRRRTGRGRNERNDRRMDDSLIDFQSRSADRSLA